MTSRNTSPKLTFLTTVRRMSPLAMLRNECRPRRRDCAPERDGMLRAAKVETLLPPTIHV